MLNKCCNMSSRPHSLQESYVRECEVIRSQTCVNAPILSRSSSGVVEMLPCCPTYHMSTRAKATIFSSSHAPGTQSFAVLSLGTLNAADADIERKFLYGSFGVACIQEPRLHRHVVLVSSACRPASSKAINMFAMG